MKFAVVEFTSKSGEIWKHTPAQPNYLADPQTEIDPTSFGCYVSAMQGEHIPLTFFIKPTKLKKLYQRVLGRWPTLDISYLKDFDVLLVVHLMQNAPSMTQFIQAVKRRYPHIVIIGVPTQPYGILVDWWNTHPGSKEDMKRFMDSCDAFLTIVRRLQQTWQAMSDTPVHYLPQPYPVTFAQQFHIPRSQKKDIIFAAGVTDRDNILKGHRVAVQLQHQFPQYRIHVTNIDGMSFDESQLKGATYDIVPFTPWREHLEYLASTAIVINTDYTQTRGRVQVDCAAVGTPSIGADSDGQEELFPSLPANRETSEEELARQAAALLKDEVQYNAVIETAQHTMQKYSYEQSAQRLTNLITTLQK